MEDFPDTSVFRSAATGGGPILVTGSHRSGSTWAGNVLSLAPGVGYVHEPFNARARPGMCDVKFPHNFLYVTEENEAPYLAPLQDMLNWRYPVRAKLGTLRTPRQAARMARSLAYFEIMRRRGARVIMKDPLALFSAEWLSDRFDMPVVVVIRHPAAFVASLLAAGWTHASFRVFLKQTRLVEDRLAPYRAELEAAVERHPEPLDMGVLQWRIFHHHIRLLRRDHPDWLFVRHEDLSIDPIPAFRDLYDRLGLTFAADTPAKIAALTEEGGGLAKFSIFGTRRRVVRNSRDNVKAFRKRLWEDQIRRIRDAAEDVWPDFYGPEDW